MDAFFWFLMGSALTLGACLATATARKKRAVAEANDEPAPPPARPTSRSRRVSEPRRYEVVDTRSLEDLSESLGAELAGLASGVEGQAQLLCETLGQPDEIAERAEQLWESVRRLRFFCEKMQSFSRVDELEMTPTNVRLLLAALALEIEDYSSGCLQVGLHIAPSLPFAMANAEALRVSVLFLIEGVLELEPDANSLVLQAHSEEGEDGDLFVRIDIEAVLDEGFQHADAPTTLIRFSYLAARNLLAAQGASFTLDHTPGLNALASITLAVTDQPAAAWSEGPTDGTEPEGTPESTASTRSSSADATSEEIPQPARAAHHFGGVLIMESNPTIRDMLARELAKTRRNVIACADGMAARTLFEATPERFEVLILERESRRLRGEELARLALTHDKRLQIVMIHAGPGIATAADLQDHPGLKILHKPFGLMELRSCLASVVGTSPRAEARIQDIAHEPS